MAREIIRLNHTPHKATRTMRMRVKSPRILGVPLLCWVVLLLCFVLPRCTHAQGRPTSDLHLFSLDRSHLLARNLVGWWPTSGPLAGGRLLYDWMGGKQWHDAAPGSARL